MSDRSTDEALKNPELDLLGLAPHAQNLADMVRTVPTPFTIGVYGEWGAGKTTFAYFVESCLKEAARQNPQEVPVEFIRFEAWPHKTADELWRALIIRIAAKLYGRKDDDLAPAPVGSQAPQTFGQWLGREAVVLRESTDPLSDEKQYAKLLARLDNTLYGGIGKSGGARWRLDQEQAMVSAVKAGFQALSAASPLVAGIRGLLKLDDGDGAGAQQREQNEETRKRIESIDQFRTLLTELLEKKGKDDQQRDRRLCIFLDDLDRCAPDVALDLLDAIKVFLVRAKFVFLVAADEEIIGRGLRIRYRDIGPAVDATNGESLADRLAREGQQYFEKIVQLRIHIPEANPQAAHRFIAAQFPEWMPATDIVFAALGSNPRRVKQYCNWMMFRHSVDMKQSAAGMPPAHGPRADTDGHPEVLHKLISLYARNEECLRSVARLAATSDYAATMAALERHLDELGEDATDDAIQKAIADTSLRPLCKQMSASEALFRLVRESPRFSTFDPLEVETLAAIADMRPRPNSVLECSDRVFMRILSASRTATISTQAYVVEEFARLRIIDLNAPTLFDCLLELATSCTSDWTEKMLVIESRVQSGKTDLSRPSGPDDAPLDDKMHAVIATLNGIKTTAYGVERPRDLLLRAPRLSEMLREVVLAYQSVRTKLSAAAETLLADRVAKTASEEQKTTTVARHAYDELDPKTRRDIEKRIGLRKWAASHCLGMRSFAKLNALDRNWPDFARRLRRDFGALRAFEAEVVSPGKLEKKYERLWAQYRDNDRLRDFLALPPLFAQIDAGQLQQYLELSQAVSQSGEGGLGTTPPPAGLSDPVAQAQAAESEYINVRVRFEEIATSLPMVAAAPVSAPAASAAAPKKKKPAHDAVPPQTANYRIEVQIEHEDELEGDMFLDETAMRAQLQALRQASLAMLQNAPSRQFASQVPLGQLIHQMAELGDMNALMKELGGAMFDTIFPVTIRARMEELLAQDRRHRFIFEGPEQVMRIPFESLYSKKARSFLALSQRFSLVRFQSPSIIRRPLPLTVPLRILAVLANPSDSSPLNLEGELEVLTRSMAPAISAGRVSLEVVPRGYATWRRMREMVQGFRPHVFHFVGHGVFGAEGVDRKERGAIVLENEDKKSDFIGAEAFATLLGEEAIQIAVLNGCDTGTAAQNEAISSMAEALTNSGVPAVIATMREVADDTALLFTREFYRGLCEGLAVEVALAEARKAMSVERRDWSVYALFASMVQLELLSTPPFVPQRGQEPAVPPRS